MTHARVQIRAAVAAALANLPTTGGNVFPGRPWPLDEGERPGIVVLTPAEDAEVDAIGPVKLMRTLEVLVIGYDDGDAIEDRLDQIALEVETAIAADPTLGGTVKEIVLSGTAMEIDQARSRAGEIRMTFTAGYRTTRAAPGTIIP